LINSSNEINLTAGMTDEIFFISLLLLFLMENNTEVDFQECFYWASLGRVLLLVTKKFALGVCINSNVICKPFGTPTAAEMIKTIANKFINYNLLSN
jgi:hypothetical protein